jgi:serine/threonine protein kinase
MTGQTILHYRIDGRLGQGGMGVVYRATYLKLLRPVALKFMPADVTADRDASERFPREARAASALDHVNVGTIFGVERAPDGRQFIVMACYQGETLAHGGFAPRAGTGSGSTGCRPLPSSVMAALAHFLARANRQTGTCGVAG